MDSFAPLLSMVYYAPSCLRPVAIRRSSFNASIVFTLQLGFALDSSQSGTGWDPLPTDLPLIVKILMVDWDGHGSLFQRSFMFA